MNRLKKVVVIGPESTGKSTLCAQLAGHFNTRWVKEYAREYLSTNGINYQYNDLIRIAEGQILNEEKIEAELSSNPPPGNQPFYLIMDTDMNVIKVWSEFVFNKCDNSILSQIARRPYDLYLLCNTDLPWVKDELREYPDLSTREKLYHYYKDILVNQPVPWIEIRGNYQERLSIAIKAVNHLK